MIKKLITVAVTALIALSPAASADASSHRKPTAGERVELRNAQRATGSGWTCHLEWDGPVYSAYEAICARKPAAQTVAVSAVTAAVKACTVTAVARGDVSSCVSLYLRPAQWNRDHSVYTPQGGALVAECLSQYRGAELHVCLNQPVES